MARCSTSRPMYRLPLAASAWSKRRWRAFGRVDILINNVGKAEGQTLPRPMRNGRAIDQTLFPAVRMSPTPEMRKTGGGVIVMICRSGPRVGRRTTHNAVKAAGARRRPWRAARRKHPRQQHRAWLDQLRGRQLVEASAGRSTGHRGVRRARTAVRPFWRRRRGWFGRRVRGVAEGKLDFRRVHPGGRMPVAF